MLAHAQTIDAKQVNSQQFRASEGRAQSTYRYVAIITGERPDGPLGRPHRESGQKIVVLNHKIKWDDGNPTGHGIIFIGMGGRVYCYVPPGGV
jgi:hypothetical protein